MDAVAIVTSLTLVQYLYFGFKVGQARGKYGIKAPAISGNVEFEKVFRVQQNTLEQLVVFLPALWMFAWFVHELSAVILGLIFIVGRGIYKKAYTGDPAKRAAGFLTCYLSTLILLLGGLGGAAWNILQ